MRARFLLALPPLAAIGLHCASLSGLDDYTDSLRAVCDRIGGCSSTFDANACYDARKDKLAVFDELTKGWLDRFEFDACDADCQSARRCLDDPLFCTEAIQACAVADDCCSFSKGYAKCGVIDGQEPPPEGGRCCRSTGAPCTPTSFPDPDTCCSGSGGCDPQTYTCGGVICAPLDAACTAHSQCCGGFCDGLDYENGDFEGTCGLPCQSDGFTCLVDAECCSGYCDFLAGGICATPTCSPNGFGCVDGTECCSGTCFSVQGDGVCADDNCFPDGSDCIVATFCCAVNGVQFCDPELHACGACRPEGQPCTQQGSCCSGACDVTNKTCVAAGACLPKGSTCASSPECCSGTCLVSSCT